MILEFRVSRTERAIAFLALVPAFEESRYVVFTARCTVPLVASHKSTSRADTAVTVSSTFALVPAVNAHEALARCTIFDFQFVAPSALIAAEFHARVTGASDLSHRRGAHWALEQRALCRSNGFFVVNKNILTARVLISTVARLTRGGSRWRRGDDCDCGMRHR